jgi:hypothetical protein
MGPAADTGVRGRLFIARKNGRRTPGSIGIARPKIGLKQEVGAVAKGGIPGILAAAKQRRFRVFGGEHQGLDVRAGVGAVAKGLLLASPAAAPGVTFARLELDLVGAELWAFRLCHAFLPRQLIRYRSLLTEFVAVAQETLTTMRPMAADAPEL